ncbi:ATP-binding cassette domain-containing protein [soil metagenome]
MADPAAADAFTLEDAGVRFGDTLALHPASLRVAAGERAALVGPSGSGKTTLLRLLNASVLASSGTASAFGQNLAMLGGGALRSTRSRIALIPQDLALVPNVSVLQNVLMGRFGRRPLRGALRDFLLPARHDVATVTSILERVGILEKLRARTDTLSGGQQQRVAIARALFQEPDALLADEPISSVDPGRARESLRLIVTLAEAEDLTLLMSLHDLALAREFFPRLIGLREGRIAFDRPADQLDDATFRALYAL